MAKDTGDKEYIRNDLEISQTLSDTFWNRIVVEALEIGMTTEDYIGFIKFIKRLNAKTMKLEMPVHYYFQLFYSDNDHSSYSG